MTMQSKGQVWKNIYVDVMCLSCLSIADWGREESKMMTPGFKPGDNSWVHFFSIGLPLLCVLAVPLSWAKQGDRNMSFITCSPPNSLLLSSLCFLSHNFSYRYFMDDSHIFTSGCDLFQPLIHHITCLLYSYSRMLLCHDHSLSSVIHLFKFSCCCEVYVTLEKLLNFSKGQLPHLEVGIKTLLLFQGIISSKWIMIF